MKKWECLDSDTGEVLAEAVRKYHIPDFSNWQPPAAFERAFARLEKDLRTSIGNAIQYNRDTGDVRVSVKPEGGRAVITVADTGQGVSAGDLPHVFERFFRADKSRTAAPFR